MTRKSIEQELAGLFYRTWTAEIRGEKPNAVPTVSEMRRWTSAAKRKIVAVLDQLAAEAVRKRG